MQQVEEESKVSQDEGSWLTHIFWFIVLALLMVGGKGSFSLFKERGHREDKGSWKGDGLTCSGTLRGLPGVRPSMLAYRALPVSVGSQKSLRLALVSALYESAEDTGYLHCPALISDRPAGCSEVCKLKN